MKNGFGTTTEIAIDPPGAGVGGRFRWRLSIADVERSGPFSADVQALPGNIVVALSDGDFVSFTARGQSKTLIGIRSNRLYPLTLPNVPRNVIAHELGHAIGLRHNSDPAMLMCGRPAPCRPDAFKSATSRFFPLTDSDKAQLTRMYR